MDVQYVVEYQYYPSEEAARWRENVCYGFRRFKTERAARRFRDRERADRWCSVHPFGEVTRVVR